MRLEKVGPTPYARAVDGPASFYVGKVFVGQPPQELGVLFDTSSGNVILPRRGCQSKACLEHRRYSAWESQTAGDVNFDGVAVEDGQRLVRRKIAREVATIGFTQVDLGEGEATGLAIRDQVCLGSGVDNRICAEVAMVAATKLDDVPFRAMPHDGIVGLGLGGLAMGPAASFLGRLLGAGNGKLAPQFGISLDPTGGEISFGGLSPRPLAAPIQWFPVTRPHEGYWQVAIHAVRVGNITVDTCQGPGGCRGIVDTGASRLGAPPASLGALLAALSPAPVPGGGCQGPSLEFDLGGISLTLRPGDYADGACRPRMQSLYLEDPMFRGVYALGEPLLKRYYAAFDWQAVRMGFAPLQGHFVRLGNEEAVPSIVSKAADTVEAVLI